MDFTLACDIMLDLEGSIRPAMYLANELTAKGYSVSVISPTMTDFVKEHLGLVGITPISLGARLATRSSGPSVSWFETWAREAFLRLNSRHIANGSSTMINFSQVISVPSAIWYLQGPPSIALRDMEREFSAGFRIAYDVLRPIIGYADEKLVSRMGKVSSLIIANSKFCASMYSKFGIRVHDVIYPPIDCQEFRPSTSSPCGDYVLTYFGKETKFSVIKRVADKGLKVKAFGSKTPYIEKNLTRHPNVEFLGKVTTDELVDLYSNALFTLFPFTHEPFGYVPLESMACGTPVLTYDVQGPSECVFDTYTGWLVHTDAEIEQKAVMCWKDGFPSVLRRNCIKEASKFDRKIYTDRWLKILEMPFRDQMLLYPDLRVLKNNGDYVTQ
jgi:glycosyltransferase involved in cell wall biosynthesis